MGFTLSPKNGNGWKVVGSWSEGGQKVVGRWLKVVRRWLKVVGRRSKGG